MVFSNNFIYFMNVFILFIHTVYVSMCVLLTYILFLFYSLCIFCQQNKFPVCVCVCAYTNINMSTNLIVVCDDVQSHDRSLHNFHHDKNKKLSRNHEQQQINSFCFLLQINIYIIFTVKNPIPYSNKQLHLIYGVCVCVCVCVSIHLKPLDMNT